MRNVSPDPRSPARAARPRSPLTTRRSPSFSRTTAPGSPKPWPTGPWTLASTQPRSGSGPSSAVPSAGARRQFPQTLFALSSSSMRSARRWRKPPINSSGPGRGQPPIAKSLKSWSRLASRAPGLSERPPARLRHRGRRRRRAVADHRRGPWARRHRHHRQLHHGCWRRGAGFSGQDIVKGRGIRRNGRLEASGEGP